MNPPEEGLDELAAAFCVAAFKVSNALLSGEELRSRLILLLSASSVINQLLRTMQYPRDQKLFSELVGINIKLTQFLDQIVLNAPEEDVNLRILRDIAKNCGSWATMVRPGDVKFTDGKIEKLQVGEQNIIPRLPKNAKKPPSFHTPINRLTSSLVEQITNLAEIISISNDEDARAHLMLVLSYQGYNLKHVDLESLLPTLRSIQALTKETISAWTKMLTEFVLIMDPTLERYPALNRIKLSTGNKYLMTEKAHFRSELSKYFRPALRYILS